MSTLALGILVSGSGTNLQAILDAVAAKTLDADVRLVLSNKTDALALERAARAHVRTRVLRHQDFSNREEFDGAMVEALREAGCDWIVFAGFMRLVTRVFLGAFPYRVINLHPALLPSFPGVKAPEQALLYGAKVTGCTVHLVDEGTDTGPIIAQRAVEVLPEDTPDSLASRIHAVEHECLVDVLRWIAADRVTAVPAEGSARTIVRVRPP